MRDPGQLSYTLWLPRPCRRGAGRAPPPRPPRTMLQLEVATQPSAGHQVATSSRSCPGWEALRAASPHGKRAAPPSLASLTQKMLHSVRNAAGAFTAPFLLESYWEKHHLSHPSKSPAIQVVLSISFPLYTEIAGRILSCEALPCRWQP